MTEYEIADLALSSAELITSQYAIGQNQGSLIVDNLTLFYSLLFGYLLAAYAVGKKLSTVQTAILTVLYLAAVIYNRFYGFMLLSQSQIGLSRWDQMVQATSSSELAAATISSPALTAAQSGVLAFVTVFVVLAILASLFFMWSVRHPRDE
jgi:hypothetical protein